VSAQATVKIGLRQLWLLCLACVWLAGAAYVMHVLDRKWIPHDDGSLAQAAERVLLGEMPHRDFADLYTGGLSLLDALAFRVFGTRLMALRYALFLFFLAWVPAFYYCASRWVAPAGAALATLLAIVWTLPNYPAAMPSWYNLFFATFGAAALFRFTETGRRGWLAAAGALGGLSLLIKIAGLYYIAACLLFLVAYEALTRDKLPPGPGGRLYRGLVVTGLAGLLLAVVALIRRHLSVEQVYHFFLPTAMLASLVARVVASSAGIDSRRAMRRLWSLAWPFAAGLAVPIVGFLVPYVAHGDVGALLQGVFVNPTTRIASAARAPLPWTRILPAGILAAFIGLAVRARRGAWRWPITLLWGGLLLAGFAIGGPKYLYLRSWASVSQGIPLVVAGGLAVFVGRGAVHLDPRERAGSVLLLALAGLCSLVEYPFAASIYFCYAAPLALLALLSVLRLAGGPPRPLVVAMAGYYIALAVIVTNHQSLGQLGATVAHADRLARLRLPRGGVLARRNDARDYTAAIDTLLAHAHGSFTYAGPDAPEIYFLSGLHNPTRTLFDFLEPDDARGDRVLAALDRHGITAIAINRKPEFSESLGPDLEAALAERFPVARSVGKFTVRWRE
jgi:hypothetical protein